uniref:Uncharacterized protein n=1 Tax=Myoviridae sp. ctijX18 TaxID=2825154 RepID=A0A8S5USU9_9CAUD|nr:MAG TPA: hypothetical protein [Myoviridae sp. ctijX18]DAQ61278.1 MAG TPA: hypothetical protein [Caudoviricetes sp.]
MSISKKFRMKADNYSTYSFKTKRIGGFKRYNKNRKTKQKASIGFRLFYTRFIREMKKSFEESKSDWTYCWVDINKLMNENPELKEKLDEDTLKLYEVMEDLNAKQKTETEES